MKTKMIFPALLSLLFASSFAQDKTTVNAMSSEISDNLDLRAVASIFGDSKNLDDFEKRLNDPKAQISNLDLNGDNQVDYLRVIESVENNVHLVVVQSVLGRDQYQDVATIEVQKDNSNKVHVQVVGNVYMYGANYIYEPVYVSVPVIYNWFWTPYYRPYCSSWYWGYYPSYYYAWNPCPLFRYQHHIGICINYNNYYNYCSYRRCQTAYNSYYNRRGNYYESQNPSRSFENRNNGYQNRYELDKTRPRHDVAYNSSGGNNPRKFDNPRGTTNNNSNGNNTMVSPRSTTDMNPRMNSNDSPRNTSNSTPRSIQTVNNSNTNPKDYNNSPRNTSYNSGVAANNSMNSPRGNDTPRNQSYTAPSYSKPRSNNHSFQSNEIASATPRSNKNHGDLGEGNRNFGGISGNHVRESSTNENHGNSGSRGRR